MCSILPLYIKAAYGPEGTHDEEGGGNDSGGEVNGTKQGRYEYSPHIFHTMETSSSALPRTYNQGPASGLLQRSSSTSAPPQ